MSLFVELVQPVGLTTWNGSLQACDGGLFTDLCAICPHIVFFVVS
jgi:hypothetical protein